MPVQQWRSKMLNATDAQNDILVEANRNLRDIVINHGHLGQGLAAWQELQKRRHKEVVRMMKWIGLGILFCAFLLGGLVYQAVAGEVPITADAGVSVMIGYKQPAESVRDLGVGIGYRPTYLDEQGIEQDSRLLFLIGGNYGSGTGDLKVLCRVSSWGGVNWLVGPGLMAIEEAGTYSLGPIGEFRIEAYAGNNPVQFTAGSGYVWRNGTEDNPNPNPVPLWVKIGVRTQ